MNLKLWRSSALLKSLSLGTAGMPAILSHLFLWLRGSEKVPGVTVCLILPQRRRHTPRSGSFVRAAVNLIPSSCTLCPHSPAGNDLDLGGERKCRRRKQGVLGGGGWCPPAAPCKGSLSRDRARPALSVRWPNGHGKEVLAVCFPPWTGILRKSILPH